MRARFCLFLLVPFGVGCRDAHGWRRALLDYARPDTVERLHAALDGERARGDTARRRNHELENENQHLVRQLDALSQIVNEIDRDLGGSRGGGGTIRPLRPAGEAEDTLAEREELEAKRQRIASNLSRLTGELHRSDSLWHAAASSDSAGRAQLASSAETLAMFKTLAENRAVQFAEFEQRLDSMRSSNRALSDERDHMRDSLARLAARMSRVYYVVGTREELLSAGVIREVTVAKKSWRGWQREKQLMPSSEAELSRLVEIRSAFGALAGATSGDDEDGVEQQGSSSRPPDGGEFRELDRYHDLRLALPPVRHSRLHIVSPQDLRYAEGVGRDGYVSSPDRRLHITDPEGFWEGGRYLVVLIER
jgi:hypothetical protein